MGLGTSLQTARKKAGLSQEEVAEKLGVSRQTISKWELNETLPDIRQAKRLAALYHLTLDALIDFDPDQQAAEEMIDSISEEAQKRIDWTEVWTKKYPILGRYRQEVETAPYAAGLRELLEKLERRYRYSREDSFLVLKDILAQVWRDWGQQSPEG